MYNQSNEQCEKQAAYLKRYGDLTGSISVAAQDNQPKEPSLINRATELLNFVAQIGDEIGEIRGKVSGPHATPQIRATENGTEQVLSLEGIVSSACTRAACALSELRTLNNSL